MVAESTSPGTGPGGWRGWPPRRRRLSDLGRWPFTVGICAALAVTAGVASLKRAGSFGEPNWLLVALVVLAVLPWVVDLLVVSVPPWIFAPVVLGPVIFLHDPLVQSSDPIILLLAVLALDMGLWLGVVRSAPVVAVAVAGPLLPTLAGGAPVPGRLVAMILGAWLVGLALHSQVRRVDRLRATQAATSARLEAVLGGVAAAREALDRHDPDQARARLAAVEADGGAASGASGRGEGGPDGTPAPPPSGPSR